jgi:hypothetical protein
MFWAGDPTPVCSWSRFDVRYWLERELGAEVAATLKKPWLVPGSELLTLTTDKLAEMFIPGLSVQKMADTVDAILKQIGEIPGTTRSCLIASAAFHAPLAIPAS